MTPDEAFQALVALTEELGLYASDEEASWESDAMRWRPDPGTL